MFREITDRREQFEGGERSEHDVDVIAFDQFLGLVLGARRVAAGIGDDQLDLAARNGEILVLEKGGDAFLGVNSAGCKRSGLDGQ